MFDKSSFCSLRDTSLLNGVSTTIGMLGSKALIRRAPSNVSDNSTPGMAITRSKCLCDSSSMASLTCDTLVTRGGELRFSATYSKYSCSSTRPSSSIIKAS